MIEKSEPKKKLNVRAKGHSYERLIANELSVKYNQKILTNRYNSKALDDRGIDLSTKDFQYQLKCTGKCVNYQKLITDIQAKNKDEKIILLSKITHKGEYAIMKKELFYELLDMVIEMSQNKAITEDFEVNDVMISEKDFKS
ncbi:hypothetical protein MM236_01040 [Belliella sp. DSM 107340]|uniref:Uncharacterized protein n=1 Tax=Belliella calami TaxID=2923436 RepID=A0ABS9UIU8_9BACT|nr:hypothetical protein [Belliella calami]MCH7396546.1 hypothetical protein [Belliella calami]